MTKPIPVNLPEPLQHLNGETLFSRYDVQHNGRGQWSAREIDAEPGDPQGYGETMDEAIRDLLEQLQEEIP